MNTHFRNAATALTLLTVLASCDRPPDPAPTAKPAAAAAAARTTCERVTAEQMAAVLGEPMNAEPVSNSECHYSPKSGSSMPMAQLQIDLGSAEAAMTASGMLNQMEPGMTDPYEGLGDQASAIGPAVWVRRGEDLVMITIMGVDAHDAAVRRVYEIVDAGF